MHPFLESFRPPQPYPTPLTLPYPDRRRGISDLEVAFNTLSHAVEYLLTEQLAGRRPDVQSNREAVALLCDSIRNLMTRERRSGNRDKAAAWLNNSTLTRHSRQQQEVA